MGRAERIGYGSREWLALSARVEASSHSLYLLTFTSQGDHWLQGTQQVAWLQLTASENQSSAFVKVRLLQAEGTTPGGAAVKAGPDQELAVVIVGPEPLLQARLSPNQQRSVVLYGRQGTTNTLQLTRDLTTTSSWTNQNRIVMTNLFQLDSSMDPGHHPASAIIAR